MDSARVSDEIYVHVSACHVCSMQIRRWAFLKLLILCGGIFGRSFKKIACKIFEHSKLVKIVL